MSIPKSITPYLLMLLLFLSCQSDKKEDVVQLGEILFETSGSVEAQPSFQKGVMLLHSFEYEDSRTAFKEAQTIDPDFAMAYWGEAMTYNHTLWQRQKLEKAQDVLSTIRTLDLTSLNEVESDLINGIEILFGDGTKYERDIAYKDYMEILTKKHPKNHEIAAFYAVSLLGSSRNGRDAKLYDMSARIAQGIIKENPKHPGALHYLIHSFDDPDHAHLAKSAADSYSKVAPDAAHALHMPSHIYVALGRWDDVVTSNIASWNASIKRMEQMGIEDGRSYHAYHWLQYGLLQRSEKEKSEDILRKMVEYTEENPTKTARRYMIAMKGAHMVENNDWTSEFADIAIDTEDLNLAKRAGYAFLNGMSAYHTNDQKALKSALEIVEKDRLKSSFLVGEKGFAMCSAQGFASRPPDQLEVDMVQVMELELKALLADLKGQKDEAEKYFEQAVSLDEELNYSYGPPRILKPVHEAYAEWLLKSGKAKKALTVYDKSLVRQPRRLLSLEGKKQAAELLKQQSVVAEVSKELEISMEAKNRDLIL